MTADLPVPPLAMIEGAALFLDFDGTLVEIAESPAAIIVPEGLASLLDRLSERLGGRLAIVTGRALEDLEVHLDILNLAVCGSHGIEMRAPGEASKPVPAPEGLKQAIAEAFAFAAGRGGLLIESKPTGLAIHFRNAPEQEQQVTDFMVRLGRATGLDLQCGKMVAELRSAGAGKGGAVRTLMAQSPFRDARPLFIGDDLTDEDGFAAASALGGAGILVGPSRPTAARFRLPDVTAVAAWLEAAAR